MNTMQLPSGLIVPAPRHLIACRAEATSRRLEADESTRLFNVAAWHQKKAMKVNDPRDAARHARIADEMFLQSHLAK